MKNHSIQFRLCWTSFEIKLLTIEIISKHYIMWNNTGPNLIYFSTSSCLSLGQIELTKYLQFSFTLASSNSVVVKLLRSVHMQVQVAHLGDTLEMCRSLRCKCSPLPFTMGELASWRCHIELLMFKSHINKTVGLFWLSIPRITFIAGTLPRCYDMKGIFQMQGGKNWILPK